MLSQVTASQEIPNLRVARSNRAGITTSQWREFNVRIPVAAGLALEC